mgnify:FL=1
MSNVALLNTLKAIAQQVNEDGKPSGIVFGTVISTEPLQIQLNQSLILDEDFLVLTHNVLDHYVDITVSHYTVNDAFLDTTHAHPHAGTNSFDSHHKHAYQGRKKIMLHYGLRNGEKVMLIRDQGGQKYVVLDRVEDPITEGEWIG